ncbi:MAG: zf-TFIIB domain-containing protein [Candidatus Omnitrophica bacterium]|nr:zf-TFIIB domain-containing protein [Candidatus Omnitrophota bacterium]MDD5437073.1 zf-TFIIB domain-containing protein [Candidatus Omnitrophota bacterium]
MKKLKKNSALFENCPKCGAEIETVAFGPIVFEKCPNCRGFFLDYDEVKNPVIKRLLISGKNRKDRGYLDRLKILCPKCKVLMGKKRGGFKGGLLLDVCPECGGVWFDYDELEKYRKGAMNLLSRPKKMRIELFCPKCDIRINLTEGVVAFKKCPHCGEWLSFKGAGELREVRLLDKKTSAALLLFIILMSAVFYGTYLAFHSYQNAAFFTGTLGLGAVIVVIRAIIYNRFSWTSNYKGFGFVKDFPINNDRG